MMEKSTTFLSDNAKKATGLYRSTKVSVYQMVIVEEQIYILAFFPHYVCL